MHIDTGLTGVNLDTIVQDLLVKPLWLVLVWVVHAVIVLLEWCYTIDLLGSSATSGLGRALRGMQATVTQPWLATVLAVASVLALYNGLVRRRVAETLAQALLVLAMMAGGLWVIADPMGTVGAISGWANQASLGTLGAVAQGTPARAAGTLADSMRSVYAGAIEAPWCFLEFGNVRWCDDPALLDRRLKIAAAGIAALDRLRAGCTLDTGPLKLCAAPGSAQALAFDDSATLLDGARTNGAIFLALPANAPERNSIKESGSLLSALCDSPDEKDTDCRGVAAAQAEFRTDQGTWTRVGGVLLIAGGAIGLVMLLGFIGLRLLTAAFLSLLYLLLAPAVVLAPALGDGGRNAFRGWATRLLGAVMAKLLYSFLLGVVLAVERLPLELRSLGWGAQWLLLSAFWWGAYRHRHRALGFIEGSRAGTTGERPRSIARRVGGTLETPRAALKMGRGTWKWTRSKISRPAPSVEQRRKRAQAGREMAGEQRQEQVTRTLEREQVQARARVVAGPEVQERLSSMRGQLERVRGERAKASASGDRRREAKLGAREQRIEGQIAREQRDLSDARRTVAGADGARRREGHDLPPSRAKDSSLDEYLRDSARRRPGRSSVMDDAREVAARRKRQLGRGPEG